VLYFLDQLTQDRLFLLMRQGRGAYQSKLTSDGKIVGPLVQYSAKYDDINHWVGAAYYNYAMIEGTIASTQFSDAMFALLYKNGFPEVIYGSPMGGLTFSQAVVKTCWSRGYNDIKYGFPDEVVTAVETETIRKVSVFKAGRHPIIPGNRYAIGEDIFNNGKSTEKMANLIENGGGIVQYVICVVNRAWPETYEFCRPGKSSIPILCDIFRPTAEYHQDDPMVAELIAANKIVRHPKPEWDILEAAMLAE
jgi:orotate phosphoribosyltransferase